MYDALVLVVKRYSMVASGVGAGVFFLLHATNANNVSKRNIFFMPDRLLLGFDICLEIYLNL